MLVHTQAGTKGDIMKEKAIYTLLVLLSASAIAGCSPSIKGNKNTENVQKEMADENQKKETDRENPDLSGDQSVPKTGDEMLGGENSTHFTSEEEMEKASGTGFEFQPPEGYKNPDYRIENGTMTAVYTDSDGSTISFSKGTDDDILAIDSSYVIVYDMERNGKRITIGSRGSEEKAGIAIWEDDAFKYRIETMQWEEVSRDEMSELISSAG